MDKRSTRNYGQEDTNDFTDNRMYHPQSILTGCTFLERNVDDDSLALQTV